MFVLDVGLPPAALLGMNVDALAPIDVLEAFSAGMQLTALHTQRTALQRSAPRCNAAHRGLARQFRDRSHGADA